MFSLAERLRVLSFRFCYQCEPFRVFPSLLSHYLGKCHAGCDAMRDVPSCADDAAYRMAQSGPNALDSGEGHPCRGLTCEAWCYLCWIVGGALEVPKKQCNGFEC